MNEPYVTELYTVNEQTLEVVAVDKEDFADPAQFGIAFRTKDGKNIAHVRYDLPSPVRTFTIYHELYHLIDPFSWGGWTGREFRANLVAGICHPIGFLWCVWLTLSIPERREFYKKRFKNKF